MAPRWVLRTLVRPSLLSCLTLAGLLVACGGGGSNSASAPSVIATRDVTVLEDDRCHHLGDEVRPKLCPDPYSNWNFVRESRWTFSVTSQPVEGRLTMHVVDPGLIGAEITLWSLDQHAAPSGDGSAWIIPCHVFRVGTNELVIRIRTERSDLIEDFQLDQIRLVVTVPA